MVIPGHGPSRFMGKKSLTGIARICLPRQDLTLACSSPSSTRLRDAISHRETTDNMMDALETPVLPKGMPEVKFFWGKLLASFGNWRHRLPT